MNILFRNPEWFLHRHLGVYYINAKEPLASKLRTLLHHRRDGVMRLKKIQSKDSNVSVFIIDHKTCKSFKDVWESTRSNSQIEWLLYEYISLCLDTTVVLSPEHIWFVENHEIVHTDWNQIGTQYTKHEFYKRLQEKIEKNLLSRSSLKFDSAPWSLYNFLTQDFTKIQLTEHAWWIRQDLGSRPKSRAMSFTLPPSVIQTSKSDDTEGSDSDDIPEGKQNPYKSCKSFPVIKGSMLHSPKIKQFENHLSSKRSKTNPTMMHRIIRISSSFLR